MKNNHRICAASWDCERVNYRIVGNLKISGNIQNSIECKKYVLTSLSNKKNFQEKQEILRENTLNL